AAAGGLAGVAVVGALAVMLSAAGPPAADAAPDDSGVLGDTRPSPTATARPTASATPEVTVAEPPVRQDGNAGNGNGGDNGNGRGRGHGRK
ncbi:MAG: serine/threonine protein kinase, partial [Chloroflexota bacterium]|nr:serine/threonine protein kinase [Chloroflexota bacterium]